jgi:hypothetical protein
MSDTEGRTATIELPTKGLERAASVEENNFVIICPSSQLHCTKFQADFVSQRICEFLRSDRIIDHFIVERIPRESSHASQLLTELL